MKRATIFALLMPFLFSACAPGLTQTAMPSATLVSTYTRAPTATATNTPLPTTTPSPIATPTPVTSPTPTSTPTPTPIPTFTLSGVIFFDYNGNGIRDEHEPPIPGATVQVGSLVALTASDGAYSLRGVQKGTQSVRVSAEGFRYISLSPEAFQPSQQPVSVRIEGNTQQDWGLMQGFLTLPFRPGIPVCVISYTDLHGNSYDNIVRDWTGCTTIRADRRSCASCGVYDWHCGIDYAYGNGYAEFCGMEVYAAAPGELMILWVGVLDYST